MKTPLTGKSIQYDRVTGDFACYYNAALIGYAPTFLQAEVKLNEFVYESLRRETVTAADLTPEQAADVLAVFEGEEAEIGIDVVEVDYTQAAYMKRRKQAA